VLDIAAPAFCAVLWLGGLPPVPTMLLALFTAFAAYTSVYALNDLVGIEFDREKFSGTGINPGFVIEASPDRHPLAQRILSMPQALAWMIIWFSIALVGCYLLNPVTALILIAAAVIEVVYCLLFKVTCLRTLLSGFVKASGPIAAIYAVDPQPTPALLLIVFAWLFFWEIGGQNVPSDWNDTVEDRRVNARTVVLTFGFDRAGIVILTALGLSVLVSSLLPLVSPARLGLSYAALSLLVGYVLLLRPGFELYRAASEGRLAARLFDRASYYPLAHLGLIATFLLVERLLT
jgi:4-hydroxybenzoate polyprenyltransferase